MRATEEFLALVGGPEEHVALDEGCLLIAAHAHQSSDPREIVDGGRAALDAMASGCDGTGLQDVLDHLFGTLGFYGNRARYDDPRNSYLDEVLARRTGIPITLSIVVIEVGRRVGLALVPVGMPGHFLVGAGDGQYIDAFERGHVLDADGCRRRFTELAGPGARWSAELLAPVGPHAVLARVLANLRQVFGDAGDLHNLDWVLALRSGIPGVPPSDRAERANVLAALGRFDEAASELERVPAGDAFNGAELRARAARWRARLN
ncbi:MAG TPA: transglutaminase-like domain-containing protein [Acidimicrobiales bacterium]|nr:transglutaminase-like domain-containing protein [Acidimicrobiales bacterium]